MQSKPNNTGIIITCVVSVAIVLAAIFSAGQIVEMVDAKEAVIIQSLSGDLKVVAEPGPTMQWFGTVTHYKRRDEFSFRTVTPGVNGGEADAGPIKIRFNDGGHATISGAISWELPLDPKMLLDLHRKFGSQQAISQQIVQRTIENAIYFTGPLMSSTESSGERRGELLSFIDDQARNGVFETETVQQKSKDPITGQEKLVNVVSIVMEKGVPKRNSGSALAQYGIKLSPLAINSIQYDKIVEDQIADRQKATNAVQLALAKAKEAEQAALTAEANGKAEAAKAKWAQETIKAKLVVEAQQKLEVARLASEEAAQWKKEQILRGEGESQRRQLVMQADGALEQKLKAYTEVNRLWADAVKNYQGNWVPGVVMSGNGSNGSGGGAMDFMNLLSAKAAKELQLEFKPVGKPASVEKK